MNRPACCYCHDRPAKRLAIAMPATDPRPYFCSARCAARYGLEAVRAAARPPADADTGNRTMTKFLDGPAAGVTLTLRRSPVYLRVTRFADSYDALDDPEDRPRATETIWAYRLCGPASAIHVQRLDSRGRRCGDWIKRAEYRVIDPQPAEEVLRDMILWRQWCRAEHAAAQPARVDGGGSR